MTIDSVTPPKRTRRLQQGEKLRSADKVERIPVKVIPTCLLYTSDAADE